MSVDVPRDHYQRPLITPPDGGRPVPYTRISTFAGALDDGYGISNWKLRLAVLGVSTNRHLMQQAAGIASRYDDPATEGKSPLSAIAEQAMTMAGSDSASATGTALHDFSEQVDEGRDCWDFMPPEFVPLMRAYQHATRHLEPVGAEVFVVNDEHRVAGSLDRLFKMPDGSVRVSDLKTGAHEPKYPLKVTTQVALYAGGLRYDPATGKRSPLHPDLDTSTGLLIHLPFKADAPRCDLFTLDLEVGRKAAGIAAEVREMRKARPIQRFEVPEPTLWDEAS